MISLVYRVTVSEGKSIVIVEEKNKAHFSEEIVERSVNYFFKGCEHEN